MIALWRGGCATTIANGGGEGKMASGDERASTSIVTVIVKGERVLSFSGVNVICPVYGAGARAVRLTVISTFARPEKTPWPGEAVSHGWSLLRCQVICPPPLLISAIVLSEITPGASTPKDRLDVDMPKAGGVGKGGCIVIVVETLKFPETSVA